MGPPGELGTRLLFGLAEARANSLQMVQAPGYEDEGLIDMGDFLAIVARCAGTPPKTFGVARRFNNPCIVPGARVSRVAACCGRTQPAESYCVDQSAQQTAGQLEYLEQN